MFEQHPVVVTEKRVPVVTEVVFIVLTPRVDLIDADQLPVNGIFSVKRT